jgi:hypothetical protein
MGTAAEKPAELAGKTVEEIRQTVVRAMTWCSEVEQGDRPHLWSAQKLRLGLIGGRGQHQAQGDLLCVRCGATATLRVSV